ncbi:flagellar hook assembly protein FlgD [Tepidiphilus margaritifer]|uniref:flagellar hook assembly protein FlgD n=1 Tax=Tepidiphilus margaritifer TaxID=203471 RepID=UPI0003F4F236|nr:flagellar hook assembly protein FlgD [Tepidiphilus margaritifer]
MSTTTTSPSAATTASSILAQYGQRETSKSVTAGAVEDMQNRFLTLLTTQLKNQDPLNPMDNAEVTSQLAQMSTVQGIEKLNALVSGLADTAQMTDMASLVGRGVLVAGNQITLTSSGGIGGVDLPSDASSVKVTITDQSGLTVRTLDLGSLEAGSHNFVWDGKADDGQAAQPGIYKLKVEAKNGSDTVNATTLQLGQVTGIVKGPKSTDLQVGDLGIFTLDEVKQIM